MSQQFVFVNAEMEYLIVSTRETHANPVKTYEWVSKLKAATVFTYPEITQFTIGRIGTAKWEKLSPVNEIVGCLRVEVIRTVKVVEMQGI